MNTQDIKALELELEQLRVKKMLAIKEFQDSKAKEIDEYISETIKTDSNFYAGYGAMLRKDLQAQYNNELQSIKESFESRENELIYEIETLKKESSNESKKQSDLIIELEKEQKEFDDNFKKLSNFKYEFNDQNQVINGAEYRELYEKINKSSKKIDEIRMNIKELEKVFDTVELEETKTEDKAVEIKKEDDLLVNIFRDIINQVQLVKPISLQNDKAAEQMQLPCLEYFDNSDLNSAVDKFYSKNKGTTYVVSDTDKEYEVSEISVKKFKNELKKSSTIRLLKDKKISESDLFRAYGKEKAKQIMKESEEVSLEKVQLPEGEFVEKKEVLIAINKLIQEKESYWLNDIYELLELDKKINNTKTK